jgi:hypothetical protein
MCIAYHSMSSPETSSYIVLLPDNLQAHQQACITMSPFFVLPSKLNYIKRPFTSLRVCFPHVHATPMRVLGLDVIVRPHGRHFCPERLKRELKRRARVPNLELLQHARVQDAQPTNLHVHVHIRVPLSSARVRRIRFLLLRARRRRVGRRPRTVVDRCSAAGEERRVCISAQRKHHNVYGEWGRSVKRTRRKSRDVPFRSLI